MNKEMKLEKQRKTPLEIVTKIGKITVSSILITLMVLLAASAAVGTVAMFYDWFIL